MTCPECTAQREARLKMELRFHAIKLALARSIKGLLTDPAGTFEAVAGQPLAEYVAEQVARQRARVK